MARTYVSSRNQTGLVLIMVMMLVIVMALMAAWLVKAVTVETKVTGNQGFKDQVFNRIEGALGMMEGCISGDRVPSATQCRSGGVDLTANTPFGTTQTVPGFLSRANNSSRGNADYWVNANTSSGNSVTQHDWNSSNQSVTLGIAGLSNTEQPKLAVERLNVMNLSGFSSDSASQGAALGLAIPYRITANANNAQANTTIQSFVYVPEAAVTTPE